MKPYFAKYFPVEGKIKQDDWYFDGTLLNKKLSEEDWRVGKDWKKAEPFLCSKNIQLGDIVVGTYSGLEYEVTEKNFPSNAADFWVKKIGKISLAAMWVTEGMEFNEDQVKNEIVVECYYPNRDDQTEIETRLMNVSDRFIPKDNETLLAETIVIKGCCNHYHYH